MVNKIKQLNFVKGREGESIARDFLLGKNFSLIEMNYENKLGEIDLIMSSGAILVFVEVKMKIGIARGTPEEMITKAKLTQIRRVAESYLYLFPKIRRKFLKYRIDGVCMVKNNDDEVVRINHYENLDG